MRKIVDSHECPSNPPILIFTYINYVPEMAECLLLKIKFNSGYSNIFVINNFLVGAELFSDDDMQIFMTEFLPLCQI